MNYKSAEFCLFTSSGKKFQNRKTTILMDDIFKKADFSDHDA